MYGLWEMFSPGDRGKLATVCLWGNPKNASLLEVGEIMSHRCILQGQVSQRGGGMSTVKKQNQNLLTLKQATLLPSMFSLELFPAPVLRASLSFPILEGNLVNLSCETKLLPQRPGLQLYFSFFMGSKTLMSRNTSSSYQMLTAKKEDSGLYWCEAATEDGKVIKRSTELELQVLGEWGRWQMTGTWRDAPFPPGAWGWVKGIS